MSGIQTNSIVSIKQPGCLTISNVFITADPKYTVRQQCFDYIVFQSKTFEIFKQPGCLHNCRYVLQSSNLEPNEISNVLLPLRNPVLNFVWPKNFGHFLIMNEKLLIFLTFRFVLLEKLSFFLYFKRK